jgi:hypothetical protein
MRERKTKIARFFFSVSFFCLKIDFPPKTPLKKGSGNHKEMLKDQQLEQQRCQG